MSVATTTRQLVVFSLGAEEYSLPITEVQEIIRFAEPRPVASDATWIKGVISLRGKIVPVCDLAARLGLDRDKAGDAKIVIVETQTGTVGVIVDSVEEVLTVDQAAVDPVPTAGTELIEAIVKIEERLIVLLSADEIFAGVSVAV